jgi:plastocyanin
MKKLGIWLMLVMAVMAVPAGAWAVPYQVVAVANGGIITGTVSYAGPPPKPQLIDITKDKEVCGAQPHYREDLVVGSGGGIANAVVFIANIDKGAPAPGGTFKFDQKGCQYSPHVLAFPAGSTVEILNSDGILHNIHTYSTVNPPINYAQPRFKKVIDVKVEHPELIRVTCDAHGWMEGWWYAFDNPYFARTDNKGHFQIKDVPPGTYTLTVWQEKLGNQSQKITVKGGQSTTADFTYHPKS